MQIASGDEEESREHEAREHRGGEGRNLRWVERRPRQASECSSDIEWSTIRSDVSTISRHHRSRYHSPNATKWRVPFRSAAPRFRKVDNGYAMRLCDAARTPRPWQPVRGVPLSPCERGWIFRQRPRIPAAARSRRRGGVGGYVWKAGRGEPRSPRILPSVRRAT